MLTDAEVKGRARSISSFLWFFSDKKIRMKKRVVLKCDDDGLKGSRGHRDEQTYLWPFPVLAEGEVRDVTLSKSFRNRARLICVLTKAGVFERGRRQTETEKKERRERERERLKKRVGGLFSFSGCYHHHHQQHQQKQQLQQQLGSGLKVTGAGGESVCVDVCVCVCVRRASGGETAGPGEKLITSLPSAPRCPLCRRRLSPPFFFFSRDTGIWRGEMWRGLKYGMQTWFLPRRRRWWQRCAPLLFGPSSTFSVWPLGESPPPTASLSVVLKPPARRRSALMKHLFLALMKLR